MMEALQLGQGDFVQLFLSNGVSMREFLSASRLETLYNSVRANVYKYIFKIKT